MNRRRTAALLALVWLVLLGRSCGRVEYAPPDWPEAEAPYRLADE